MAITPLSLSSALKAMGVAQVFVGDPMKVGGGGMINLGATEGDITFDAPYTENALTAPEYTGAVPHAATYTLGAVAIKVPLIMGDDTVWAKITPGAAKGGGFSSPQTVVTVSVLVIPIAELGTGLSYASGAWTPPATLKNAVWLWKAYPTIASVPFRYTNGGKVITEVTFHAMFDASKPEGQKVYSIGDPTTATPNPVTGLII